MEWRGLLQGIRMEWSRLLQRSGLEQLIGVGLEWSGASCCCRSDRCPLRVLTSDFQTLVSGHFSGLCFSLSTHACTPRNVGVGVVPRFHSLLIFFFCVFPETRLVDLACWLSNKAASCQVCSSGGCGFPKPSQAGGQDCLGGEGESMASPFPGTCSWNLCLSRENGVGTRGALLPAPTSGERAGLQNLPKRHPEWRRDPLSTGPGLS